MEPIVNGLKVDFENQVTFLDFNARDGGDGEQLFSQLSLPGHPSFVIYDAAGTEVYRSLGIVEEGELLGEIEGVLAE